MAGNSDGLNLAGVGKVLDLKEDTAAAPELIRLAAAAHGTPLLSVGPGDQTHSATRRPEGVRYRGGR